MSTYLNTPIPNAPGGAVARSYPNNVELSLVGAGVVFMYVPTIWALEQQVWNIVGQGHGPVMLALMLWLIWQRWGTLRQLPPASSPGLAGASLLVGILSYVIGRSQDILVLDVGSAFFILSGILLAYWGKAGLRTMIFPLFFIIFIIPLPGPIVDKLTGPMKAGVSWVAESLLYHAGYPIGRQGVTLSIGPYQLLVADACAGLNSLFALEAIGVFYMSVVKHTNKWRNIALATLIVPISFVSNVIRVIVLVLVTYYLGDAVGQGFVHGFAGILLFMVATVLTIGADSFLGLFIKDKQELKPKAQV